MKADMAARIKASCAGRPDITVAIENRGGQPGYEVYQVGLSVIGQDREEHYVVETVARARLAELGVKLLSRDKWNEVRRRDVQH